MFQLPSTASLCLAFLTLMLLPLLAGCDSNPKTDAPNTVATTGSTLEQYDLDDTWLMDLEQMQEQERALDLGQDWADVAVGGGPSTAGPAAPRRAAALPNPDVEEAEPAQPQDEWVIVIGTFTQDAHREAAENMIAELRRIKPELTDLRINTTQSGSMVCYGSFDDPKSQNAQNARTWLKTLTYNNRQLFSRTMITRIKSDVLPRSPYALMSVRKAYPTISPLYTLQVAAWSDFESGKLSLEEIRAQAEQYTKQLRTQGYPAYFHHDDYKHVSIVTIGLWNESALDPATGFMDPEIEQLRKKFPAHLYNGEEVRLPVNKNRPDGKTYAQPPFLVEVPTM